MACRARCRCALCATTAATDRGGDLHSRLRRRGLSLLCAWIAAQALASEAPDAAVTATQEPATLGVVQNAVLVPLRVIPQVLSSRADMISGGDVLIRVLVPVIDYRAYTDDLAAGDLPLRYHSFAVRAPI